ncbi:MAG: DNA-binding protein [Clostridia bacterium]|nr:DNA-binding protein [Clostridia bacterium]
MYKNCAKTGRCKEKYLTDKIIYDILQCGVKKFTLQRVKNMTEKDLFVGALNDVYGAIMGEKQRRIISAYFDEDLSLAEIAENEDITRQAVLDSIKRTSAKLYDLEEKCGYTKKFLKLKELSAFAKSGDENSISEIIKIIDDL